MESFKIIAEWSNKDPVVPRQVDSLTSTQRCSAATVSPPENEPSGERVNLVLRLVGANLVETKPLIYKTQSGGASRQMTEKIWTQILTKLYKYRGRARNNYISA